MFYLSPVGKSVFKAGVENNEDQDGGDYDHVADDNETLFHELMLPMASCFPVSTAQISTYTKPF